MKLEEIWNKTKNQLLQSMPEADSIWLESTYYDSEEENSIVLAVPSQFYLTSYELYCKNPIQNMLDELSGTNIHVQVVVKEIQEKEDSPTETEEVHKPITPVKLNPAIRDSALNSSYTFDSFVSGDNTLFAYTSAKAVAMNPGGNYNPFLLYGGVGLGKTHLLQSIGNFIRSSNPNATVIYVTAEVFTNEFIEAISKRTTPAFKQKYRKADVLLIDDIHFFQKTDAIQEEFFHTFNALYESQRQIVMTCDRPISELSNITDRLRSRFSRGLNVNLQPPNYETRMAILQKKCQERGITIDVKILDYLSQNIKTNVRDLEGALTTLIAYSELIKKNITIEIAQEQLKNIISSPIISNQDISPYMIIKEVGAFFGIDPSALRGKKKTKAISDARNIAIFLCRNMTEYSLLEIGKQFDGRDHSTVLYAYKKVESAKLSDSALATTIDTLKTNIMSKIK